ANSRDQQPPHAARRPARAPHHPHRVEARMSPAQVAGITRAPQAAPTTGPTVSVVIAAYSDDRWTQLSAAVASVHAQPRPALETIVVVDHNQDLLSRARRELPDTLVISNTGTRGAS